MIVIIISACMAAEPANCKDHRIPVDGDYDPTQCAMYAPPHFAKWAEENPGWTIVRWKCQPATANDI